MDTFFLVTGVLGGLAIVIFALELLASEMAGAAGGYLRKSAIRHRRRPLANLIPGVLGGVLLQTRQAARILLSHVNAGFTTPRAAAGFWAGAGLGAAAGAVLLSLKLSPYFYIAITVGFVLRMVMGGIWRRIGGGLMAAGLMFLGVFTMAHFLEAHREALSPLAARLLGGGWPGWMAGLAAGGLLAAGTGSALPALAVIFAAAHAGFSAPVRGLVPILAGAQLGLLVPLLASGRDSPRSVHRTLAGQTAYALLSTGLIAWLGLASSRAAADPAAGAARLYLEGVAAASLIVGLSVARGSGKQDGNGTATHLDYSCLDRPEEALRAVLRELYRVAGICRESMALAGEIMLREDPRRVRQVQRNEEVVDGIKTAMRDYIREISLRRLSRRQAILVQHLNRCMVDLERIGDHVANIADISLARFRRPETIVDEDTFALVYRAYQAASAVLDRVVESLSPDLKDHQEAARRILEVRDAYLRLSLAAKKELTDRLVAGRFPPCAGIYLSAYISTFDRLVKHAKMIALAEQQPQFWIKESKLGRTSELLSPAALSEPVPAEDYLKRLQLEEFL